VITDQFQARRSSVPQVGTYNANNSRLCNKVRRSGWAASEAMTVRNAKSAAIGPTRSRSSHDADHSLGPGSRDRQPFHRRQLRSGSFLRRVPLMRRMARSIINGIERVIRQPVHRSPGDVLETAANRTYSLERSFPTAVRGRVTEYDQRHVLYVRIDASASFWAQFLRALCLLFRRSILQISTYGRRTDCRDKKLSGAGSGERKARICGHEAWAQHQIEVGDEGAHSGLHDQPDLSK